MLPSSAPSASYNPRPGTTVAELQQYLRKNLWTATTTTDPLEGNGQMFFLSMAMTAQSLGNHPVIKSGSADDILEGTQVLVVIANLEARLQSPHKAASSSAATTTSSSSSSSSSSTKPEPLDDPGPSNNLAVNALSYVSTIAGAVMTVHCRNPNDAAPLRREPFNGIRKALLPRLRQFLFAPNPQVVQAALQTAGILTGIAMVPGFQQLEQMLLFDRHPTRWVLARFLDSGAAVVTQQQLRSLVSGLQAALTDVSDKGPGLKPITVNFDFPASSFQEVAVCDGCGRHNYFPVLVRWAWKESCQLKACSGCKQRRYCSAECQKVHWQGHKQRCKAMQAQRTSQQQQL